MEKPSLSLTIIALFLVITGMFGLYRVLTIEFSLFSLEEIGGGFLRFHQALGTIGFAVPLVCTYVIFFKAWPLSRVLYVLRRAGSILLFVLGAELLLAELLGAFIDFYPDPADKLGMLGLIAVIAAVPLVLGAWASPGAGWPELGVTILIAVGIALVLGALMVLLEGLEPKAYGPGIAPLIGTVNLLVIGAIGWLLCRVKTER